MTKARDLANIISGGFTVADLPTLTASEIPNLDASKITTGSIADARIPASAVSQHATSFDDNAIVNDISTLALRSATSENAIAYSTSNQFIDVFQDSSGIASHTTSSRNASEYVSSISTSSVTSTITLNASNYQTYFDITDNEFASVRNHSSSSNTDTLHYNTAQTNNVTFASGSNLSASQTISQADEVNLVAKMFGSSSDPNDYEITNDNSSEVYRLIYHNLKFKSGITFRPNGTFSANARNGTGNWNNFIFYGINPDNNFSYTNLGEQNSPSGAFSFQVSQSTFFKNLSMRVYHNANNGYMFNDLSIAGDVIAPTTTTNATGNFISNAITAPSSTSKMGAIITYQDQAGTNTLNTDIVLQLSADNGSNFTTATLTALPNFATGIKMAKVNDLSVTAGTQLKYKISFANQSSGSKEARIRGVSLQY